jgi:general secretion pathway protein D
MTVRRACWFAIVLLTSPLVAQAPDAPVPGRIKEMRFVNQPITDILLALAEVSGRSMVPDETVRGDASYYFAETDFDTALRLFLDTYKLYVRREGNIYYISRIRAEWDAAAGLITMHAEDVEMPLLIRAASRAIGRTILFDPLPGERLTVHADAIPPDKLLEILLRRFPDYKVEVDASFFYVKREPRPAAPAPGAPGAAVAARGAIQRDGERYAINAQKARFQDLLAELFQKAGREYSLFFARDVLIDSMRFQGKSFDDLLRLLLEQAGADYTELNNITYVYEIQQRDVLKKLKTTIRVPLTYVASREIPNLLPAGLVDSRLFKIDTAGNAIILNGSLEEITPLADFLKAIDAPVRGMEYQLFTVDYLDPKNIKAALPPEFAQADVVAVPGARAFVVALPPARREVFARYLSLVDRGDPVTPVRLKYVRSEDFVKTLPPSIAKEDVIVSADPTLIFVRGGAARVAAFLEEVRQLDVPVPQIRYQFLVLQHQRGEGVNWGDSSGSRYQVYRSEPGEDGAIVGNIGQLLSLNFDAVDALGYEMAARLSLDLSRNTARIMADTTLIGTSTQEVKFQNTDTYRYREPEVQEDGSVKYTGVSREITAGLIFTVKGWVSGDGMITMDVSATISKQGTDTSGVAGALPPTSENVVTTRVRTPGGKPVVIGGMMKQEKSITDSRVPVLGDIPVLGLLFRSKKESVDNTELVIYIVPHLEYAPAAQLDTPTRLDRLYKRLVKGTLG